MQTSSGSAVKRLCCSVMQVCSELNLHLFGRRGMLCARNDTELFYSLLEMRMIF